MATSVISRYDKLNYIRQLSSSDDCNNLKQGIYMFQSSAPINAPSGTQYGILVVFAGTDGERVYNLQLLSTSGRGFYYRRKQGVASDAFSAWTKVTGTQV